MMSFKITRFQVASLVFVFAFFLLNNFLFAQTTILTQDFDSVTAPALPSGWTTENPNGGFTFMTGDSTAANSGGFWAIDPHGQFAFASDDACNCNMSEVRLILPPLDLTNFNNVSISAEVWLDNVYGSDPFEFARIEVSLDNGTTWTSLGTNFPPVEAWQSIAIDLSLYDGTPNILVAFRFNDNGNWGRGLAVDDVEVTGFPSGASSCFFEENFQSVTAPGIPAGWTTENPNGGFTFMTGDSTAANSGGFWAIDPHGQFAFASDDACNCNMSEVRLILPAQDLSNYTSVTLKAEVWLDNVYGSDPFETARIEVSTNNGSSWTPVGSDFTPVEAWQSISIDLSAYDGMNNVLIAFRFDDNGNWGRGLAVDDVCLEGISLTSCFFNEDFQGVTAPALPAGWATTNPNGGFTFMTGDSTAANSGGFWAIDPHGQFAFASDDACNCNMSEVRLILPPQDFSGLFNVTLNAQVWLDNVYGSDPFETARIEVSLDNGGTWTAAGPDFPPLEAWQNISVNLSVYDGMSNVWIAFRFDDNGNWGRGLAVDNVCLSGSTGDCPLVESFQTVAAPALPSGWTTTNPNGGFTFMTGDSTAANSGGFWAIDPHGQFAFASDDACNCDMSEVRLILPPQDLSSVTGGTISAEVWLDNVYGSDPFETARIEVSTNNGASWSALGPDFPPLEAWQSVSRDLGPVAGQSNVWIAFRFDDNGNWGRGLAVDNVSICLEGEPTVNAVILEAMRLNRQYSAVPLAHITSAIFRVNVENQGGTDLTNLFLTTKLFEESNLVTPAFTQSSSMVNLSTGSSMILDSNPSAFPFGTTGRWLAQHIITHDASASETDPSNDTIWTPVFEVTQLEYARHDETSTDEGGFGIGGASNDNGIIGQNFRFLTNDILESVEVTLDDPDPGMEVSVALYACNAMGKPMGQAIDTTLMQTAAGSGDETFNLLFDDPLSLPAGIYFFGVLEPGPNIGVKGWSDIYTAPGAGIMGTNWVRWDGVADWTEPTTLVAAFAVAYAIKPILGLPVGIEDVQDNYSVYVFPNPASEFVSIQVQLEEQMEVKLDVYSVTGQLIHSYPAEEVVHNEYKLLVKDIPAGVYMARMIIGEDIVSKRFVVSH